MVRPKVLIVETDPGSGDWHYANMLSSALADEGVDVTLATLSPVEPVASPRTVPIFSIGLRPPMFGWPRRLLLRRASHHVERVWRLWRLVADLRPDIIHFQRQLGVLDFAYLRYMRRLGLRLVCTVHGPLPPRMGPPTLARFKQMDLILAHARETEEQLVAVGLPRWKIKRILHGSYVHLCQPCDMSPREAKELLGIPANSRVILFFGSIEWRKGLDRLIDAFGMVAKDHPDLYLAISGYANEDFLPYEAQMSRLRIRERVTVNLDWIPYGEMQRYFNAAFMVVLPYRRISQSGVLQLAYAFSRPVVVTNVGGIGETVPEDGTGLVTKSCDAGGIAEAIRELLSDPERAERMGRRGRELAETKYSWSGIARDVARLYHKLCRFPDGD